MVRPVTGLGRKPKNVSLPVEFFTEDVGEISLCASLFKGDYSAFVEFCTRTVAASVLEARHSLDHEEAGLLMLQGLRDRKLAGVKQDQEQLRRLEAPIRERAARVEAKRAKQEALRQEYPTPESVADKLHAQADQKLRQVAEAAGHDPRIVLQLAEEIREAKRKAAEKASAARRRAALPRARREPEDPYDVYLARRARKAEQANLLVLPDEGAKPDFGGSGQAEAPPARAAASVAELLSAKPIVPAKRERDA